MAGRRGGPREVFVSHAAADRGFTDALVGLLRRHGVPCWYAPNQLVAAEEWHDEIGRALDRCDWLVIVLSPTSIKSAWVKRELMFALNERRYNGRILPVIHRPCKVKKLSWTLGAFEHVDFSSKTSEGCRQLLRAFGMGYKSHTDDTQLDCSTSPRSNRGKKR